MMNLLKMEITHFWVFSIRLNYILFAQAITENPGFLQARLSYPTYSWMGN